MAFSAGQTLQGPTLEQRMSLIENPPMAELRRVAAFPVATGSTYYAIPFDDDGAGVRDPWGMWSSVQPTRIIVPAGLGGRWLFRAHVQWTYNAGGSRAACWTKNGTSPNQQGNGNRLGQFGCKASDATETATPAEWEENLVPGDYMELWVTQNAGSNMDPAAPAGSWTAGLRVYVRRLGPAL